MPLRRRKKLKNFRRAEKPYFYLREIRAGDFVK